MKIKKLILTLAASGLMSLGLLESTAAHADDNAGTSLLGQSIAAALGFSTINILHTLYFYMFDVGATYNSWVQSLIVNNATQATIQSSHAVSQQAGQTTTQYVFNTTAALPPSLANIPLIGKPPKVFSSGVYAAMVPITHTETGLAKSSYLSSGTLLSSTKFSAADQAQKASVFIQFLADLGNRVQPVDGQTLENADPSTVATYLNTLATYNAGQSVGINALLNLYNERVPVPQLNGESALSYDEKQVLNRMQPTWTAAVSKMTVVNVARETLYTQAEMNYQLFQLRMQLEQLNATLAAMQLQQQQLTGKPILQGRVQQIMQSVNSSTNAATQQQ